jgi:alanyl-tRNA synthetase
VRRGLSLGIPGPFLYRIGGVVIETMQSAHPHLAAKREHIALVLKSEEERFEATIAQGTAVFEDIVESVTRGGGTVIPGDRAFSLYDTYGFPLDLTEEMARERGLSVDAAGAAAAMDVQKERARRASSFTEGAGRKSAWREVGDPREDSVFVGYDLASDDETAIEEAATAAFSRVVEADVIAVRPGKAAGDVEFAVTRTPFYAEAGGQVSDIGRIDGDGLSAEVVNVYVEDGRAVHVARAPHGTLSEGLRVRLSVDLARRRRTERNHTATHLLQAALRRVLGDHVHQSGSWVGPERLRFDLTHFSELSDQETALVEDAVNAWIRTDLAVTPERTSISEALAKGAMALFGEKYGDVVRCVSVGGVSLELCGGTHVRRTGEIGAFSIVSETSVASGVRRIEAVTGGDAVRRARQFVERVREASSAAKSTPDELVARVRDMVGEIASLRKEIGRQRQKASGETMVALAARAREVRGVKVVSERTEAADIEALREQADRLRDALGSGVGVIGAEIDGSAVIIAVVTDDLAGPKRVTAGDVVRDAAARMGGRGGGKPRLAQAGGGDAAKLDDALGSVYADVERLLGK